MLTYDIRIDGTTVKTAEEIFVFTRDKTFDSGKFSILSTTREQPYPVWAEITGTVTNGANDIEIDGYIESRQVKPINIATKLVPKFRHDITIVERTAKFDNYTVEKRALLQPAIGVKKSTFDFAEDVRETIPFELSSKVNTTRLWEFGTSWDITKDIEGDEFIIDKSTVREVLNKYADKVSGIIRSKRKAVSIFSPTTYPHHTMEIDFLNKTGNLADRKLSISGFQDLQDMQNYATSLDVTTSNVVNTASVIGGLVWEPNMTEFSGLRADDGDFPESQSYFPTTFPKFRKFQIKMKVPTKTLGDKIINITENVVEQSEYDTLEFTSFKLTPPILFNGLYQSNALIWDFQSDKVTNWFTEFDNIGGAIGKSTVYENVVISGLTRLLGNSATAQGEFEEQAFNELEIQVAYSGFYETRFKVERIDSDDINRDTTRILNQADTVTSSTRINHSVFVTIQTIGNQEYRTVAKATDDLSKILDVGDYTSDGYIVTKVELNFFRNKYIAKYEWTKNYQKQNEEIGIDSKPELWQIPTNDRTVRRNLYYSEYLKATFDVETQDPESSITDRGLEVFMNTLRGLSKTEDDAPPFHAFFRDSNIVIYSDPDGTPQSISPIDSIVLPITSWGEDNSLHFMFQFKSPNIAGQQVDFKDVVLLPDKPILRAVQYTDADGDLDTFTVKYVNGYFLDNKNKLPLTTTVNTNDTTIQPTEFKAVKSEGDILALTFGLHIIPDDDIIIGRFLAQRNNLVELFTTQKSLFLIKGSGRYDKFEIEFGKTGHTSGGSFIVQDDGLLIISATLTDDSWAIVDINNNLYLAVNQRKADGDFDERLTVRFVRKRKRDDIIDVY